MKKLRLKKIYDFSSSHRKWLWGIGALILLYSFIAGDTGFYNQVRLVREGKQIEKKIAIEKARNENLKNEVQSLKTDKERLRLEAYKLGMAAKDEVMIIVDEKK